MKKTSILSIALLAALMFVCVAPTSVIAQQKVIELSYGTPYGPDHTFSLTDKEWMTKIEKETNGRVKFKPFWGGTIIGPTGNAIDEMVKGVADIGMISPGQAKIGYDISKASFLLYAGINISDMRRVFLETVKKFPEIEKEYKGLKVMCWSSGTEYQLLSRKPVRKLADLKGMRIKTLGEIIDVLKDLGVEGMASPMGEVYMNMQKGVLDGAFTTYSTLSVFKFSEVAKYMTLLNLSRVPNGTRVMSLTTWNKLPPDIQKVFQDNIEWYGAEADRDIGRDDKAGIDYGKKGGVEYINLPKEDYARFYQLIGQEALKSTKDLDTKGLPGTRLYQEIQRLTPKK